MKDASSTDVIVHRGTALTSFYQCGDLYRVDPCSGETLGKSEWGGALPLRLGGVGASEGRRHHRRAAVLHLQQAGALHALRRGRRRRSSWCTSSTSRCRARGCRTIWRSPRTTSILNDFPLFWDPKLLRADVHLPGFHRGHAVAVRGHPPPRRHRRHPVVRGRPDVRAALHQRIRGRRRDRARRVLRGRPRTGRSTGDKWQKAFRFLALDRLADQAAPLAVQSGHRPGIAKSN